MFELELLEEVFGDLLAIEGGAGSLGEVGEVGGFFEGQGDGDLLELLDEFFAIAGADIIGDFAKFDGLALLAEGDLPDLAFALLVGKDDDVLEVITRDQAVEFCADGVGRDGVAKEDGVALLLGDGGEAKLLRVNRFIGWGGRRSIPTHQIGEEFAKFRVGEILPGLVTVNRLHSAPLSLRTAVSG